MSEGQFILVAGYGLFKIQRLHSNDNVYLDVTLTSSPVFESYLRSRLKIPSNDELRVFF
jgi:hypothetical protein